MPSRITSPIIQITNFNNFNGNTVLSSQINAVYKEHAFDPSDVVTLIVGKHVLHFGGEFLIYQNNSTAWGNIECREVELHRAIHIAIRRQHDNWCSLRGLPAWTDAEMEANETPEYGGREKLPQIFVQDDYKISPT